MLFHSPLEQFIIISLFSVNNQLSILFLQYIILLLFIINIYIINNLLLLTYWKAFCYDVSLNQSVFILYNSGVAGNLYIVFYQILTLLLFCFNTIGIIPAGFTPTSHIILMLFLSVSYFFAINIICLLRYSAGYFKLFMPSGTPRAIIGLVFLIEVISYYSRLLSLAIRIFANVMSGHILLHILCFFFFSNLISNYIIYLLMLLPVGCLFAIIFMEILICYLQIYVFLSLANLYLLDTFTVDNH